jgi:hypothetical protein
MGKSTHLFVGLLIASFYSPISIAATITINSGSSLIISGGTQNLDCDDIKVVVNDGGTLSISGGVVNELNVQVNQGGTYTKTGGEVRECDGFYIIQTPNGAAIINL